MSVRLKLALSYVAFLMVAVGLLLVVVWVFLLRYVPPEASIASERGFYPGRRDLVNAFAPVMFGAIVILLLFSLVGGLFLAGRMLAPLQRITDATRKVASGSYSQRIQLPGPHDEFRELADSFDGMLIQLETHVAEQQRFAANASHELRTPLAVTQTIIDTARRAPTPDIDKLLERLHISNSRAIELTEALLVLSAADSQTFTRGQVDLSLAAEQAAEILLPLAERNGVEIEVSGEIARTDGSAALLEQLVTNLVQNAIVHNRPTHGSVQIHTEVQAQWAVLIVENTGKILDAQVLSTITEPFQRGTSRIHGTQAGVGLGLAIVRSIVAAHDGFVSLEPRDGGGLRVTVRLPLSG